METLFLNRNVIVSIFAVMLLIYGVQGVSYAQGAAPTVIPGETNRAISVSFRDTFYAYDEKSYQVQLRRKEPQGDWILKCGTIRDFFDSGARTFVVSFTDLEPDTTYQARWRETNEPNCSDNPPNPDPWSPIGEGTTLLVTPPRVEFVDALLARKVRIKLKLYIVGVELLKIPEAKLATLTHFAYNVEEITPFRNTPRISDLTGLEHATQLSTLSFEDNNLRDITPLAQLTQLTELNLRRNNISDITPLTQLTQLTKLNLTSNNISDLTPLSELTQLKELYISGNKIKDLTPLTPLTQLVKLIIADNNISDLTPLTHFTQLTQLTELNLYDNNISDITPLAHLTQLTKLNLGSNNISDLKPLSQLTQLTELDLGFNKIKDITPLTPLTQLTELSLPGNNIRDVTPLVELISLEYLSLIFNPIEDSFPLNALLEANPDVYIDIGVSKEKEGPTITTPETPATTNAGVSISPTSVASPATGEQITFNLNIAGGEAVAGYQATVQFDTTALRYVSSTNSDYLLDTAFFAEPKVEGNLIKLNAVSFTGETSGDGTLATLTFEIVSVKPSTLTLSDVLLTDNAGNTFVPHLENAEITEPTGLKGDVNGDGIVNIADLVLAAANLGETGPNAADVNGDGTVNITDLVLVASALGNSAAAPSLHPHALEILTATEVKQWLTQVQQLNLTDTTSLKGIRFLEQLLVALIPKETALLANFPNPFNPETWIPYHLAKPAEVTITIYAINGQVVRRLELGHQPAGVYQTRSRAAYWDGRNAFSEPVASGVYFYTLTAGDFNATRKMLIRK